MTLRSVRAEVNICPEQQPIDQVNLQAVMKDDQEDIPIRMAFLAKKYTLVGDSKAAD